MKEKLNPILKWLLVIFVIRHVINIPQQLIKVNSGLYDNDICYVTIGSSIIMIAILINILRIKRDALSFFFVFLYINAIVIGDMDRGDYFMPVIVATLFSCIMVALLFLKKDGVSGWKLFYPPQK